MRGQEWFVGPDQDINWFDAKSWIDKLVIEGGGWRMPTHLEATALYGIEFFKMTCGSSGRVIVGYQKPIKPISVFMLLEQLTPASEYGRLPHLTSPSHEWIVLMQVGKINMGIWLNKPLNARREAIFVVLEDSGRGSATIVKPSAKIVWKGKIIGDIMAPVVSPEDWDALR